MFDTEDKHQRMAEQKIRDLAERLGISQMGLSAQLGLAANTIPNYLAKKRIPAEFVCLLLAGLSEGSEDRAFWIRASGLTADQLNLIRKGLRLRAANAGEMGEIEELLSNPQTEAEAAVVNMVLVMSKNRSGGR